MALHDRDFDDLLVEGASWVLAALAGWALLLLLAGVLERLSAGRCPSLRWVGCPRAWRPAVLLVASAVVALPAVPASAGTGWLPAPERTSDAPTSTQSVGAPTTAPDRDQGAEHLVVRPGDSLWSLARGLLPRAGDREVQALVARLHATNRDLVGADPDLIHPGQRLRLPSDTPGASR